MACSPRKNHPAKTDVGAEAGCQCGGVSRRNFIKSMGTGAMAVATAGVAGAAHAEAAQSEAPVSVEGMLPLTLQVNGRRHSLLVEPRWTLLFVLRERLGVTGAKEGCARGECGACSVLIDDEPRYACLTLALEAAGRKIETVEGLLNGDESLGPVQEAFVEEDAYQCGYCTPGQVIAAEGLLRKTPQPSLEEIRVGMSGNLCRCGAYNHIFNAVAAAAEKKQG